MWLRRNVTRRRVITMLVLLAASAVVYPGGTTPSSTNVSCKHSQIDVGRSLNCQATVFGFSPTGPVFWDPKGQGNVTYSPAWCSLSVGQCDVSVNGTGAGPVGSNASYLGDANNLVSGAGTSLTVNRALSPPTIAASPRMVRAGAQSSIVLKSSFSGGTAPYICQWLQAAPGARFLNLGTAFTCTPTSVRPIFTGVLHLPGLWQYQLLVTDSSDDNAPLTVESNAAGVNVTGAAVIRPSMTLSCLPGSVILKRLSGYQAPPSAACRVRVRGYGPTGTVSWSSDSPGSFHGPICQLIDGYCLVKFVPNVSSPLVSIMARYNGDKHNPRMNATQLISVVPSVTRTKMSCIPPRTGMNLTITCFVSVRGFSPTGVVKWHQDNFGAVAFVSNFCTLNRVGGCFITVTGIRVGRVILTASYLGDSSNKASDAIVTITIEAPERVR